MLKAREHERAPAVTARASTRTGTLIALGAKLRLELIAAEREYLYSCCATARSPTNPAAGSSASSIWRKRASPARKAPAAAAVGWRTGEWRRCHTSKGGTAAPSPIIDHQRGECSRLVNNVRSARNPDSTPKPSLCLRFAVIIKCCQIARPRTLPAVVGARLPR